jgi:hypothetical protein
MARNSKRKFTFTTEFFIMLLLSILVFSVVTTSSSAQTNPDQQSMSEIEKATYLIKDNEILKIWQNESTQIGIGTVQNVSYKYDKTGALMTYVEISVDVPLTDTLHSKQTITAKYPGGKIDDKIIVCHMFYNYFPNDTIVPLDVYEVNQGMSVMFFVEDKTRLLMGYIPYLTDGTDQISYETDVSKTKPFVNQIKKVAEPDVFNSPYPMANQITLATLLSEPQPTTQHVAESHGYGYDWAGYRMDWDDLPEPYHLDPDGTADIPGTDEFTAIHASFATWENDPCSGIDFTYGGTKDYDNSWTAYDQDPDGYSVVGWVSDYYNDAHLAVCFVKASWSDGYYHISEADIMINDGPHHWIMGEPFWWYEKDLQSVVTHEVGHFAGLGHVDDGSNSEQTMFWQYDGGIGQRELDWGDFNGAHYVYPVHNDAGSGSDGSNDFAGATLIQRNVKYSGHLCHELWPLHPDDAEDYFKFYAPAGMWVYIGLVVPEPADFDLELYNPNGNLVAFSRQDGNGIDETINQHPMGTSGYWRMRIFTTEEDNHGDGQYNIEVYDYLSAYVSSIEYAGPLSGQGGVLQPDGMIGPSPDDYAAGVYAWYNYGDAGVIVGHLNAQMGGTSNIYIYGGVPFGYDAHVLFYVSQNNYYDWDLVEDRVIYGMAEPTTLHFGPIYSDYRYVCIVVMADYWLPQFFVIDCVIATR